MYIERMITIKLASVSPFCDNKNRYLRANEIKLRCRTICLIRFLLYLLSIFMKCKNVSVKSIFTVYIMYLCHFICITLTYCMHTVFFLQN